MSDEALKSALKDFKRSAEITRDVRFQANLRLAGRQRGSSYIVSLLSLYVIALSLIPNILKLEQSQNQILLACSVVLSVFVIFTSLLDGSQNFYHQGELLHQCARKIATINYELKNIDVEGSVDNARVRLEELQKNYQSALDECPINHDNVDFYREIVHKPHLFPREYPWSWQFPHKTWYRFKTFLFVNSWWFGHLLAGAVITYIVYRYVFLGAALITAGASS
ncbi:SLATT domain-containing protein [Methylobacterium sp. BTF04]|uniref:SLATT domain-containing protein n=1 Tax=Methylobacterium sp. BTF04 TaxID=2708300 RepID=UPI0013D2AADC|nr:SLATT domain-containing protein [Methylobacterium sp. BTF04]NEU12820.1 SLATT domain-containing protein [Methylobacterium sp. BTF04]